MRLVLLFCALLGGCASTAPQAISGDRAAGTVTIQMIRPNALASMVRDADWTEAHELAAERCRAWGYRGAEPFAQDCEEIAITGRCLDYRATREYQCVD